MLEERRSELSDAAVAAMLEAIPAYGELGDEFVRDLRDHVDAHYETLLRTLGQERAVTAQELAFVRAPASRRARNRVALADFLHAFRVGQQVLWDALVEEAGRGEHARDAALSLAGPIMQYIDHVSTHAGEVYLEVQQRLMADADRARRDLLEHLLAGEEPSAGPMLALAQELGLGPGVPTLLAAVVPAGPRHGGDGLQGAADALTAIAPPGGSALVVVRHNEVVAVAPMGGDGPGEACRRVEEAATETGRRGLALAVGVSTPAERLEQLPRAYREACDARDRVPEGGGVLALPTLSAFAYLNACADETARRLVDERTRTFLEEDRAKGGALVETLRAFVDCDLNVRRAAGRLYVHPNTAHYRLGRIAERTGRDLRRVTDLMELMVAVDILEPRSTPTRGDG